MFYYNLHAWLTKTSFEKEHPQKLVDLQVKHVKELVELQGEPMRVPNVLLQSAIEIAHIDGGADGLTDFANHLRRIADSIDVRIRRNDIRTVSTIGKPTNQE